MSTLIEAIVGVETPELKYTNLIAKLSIAAVELFSLGAEDDSGEIIIIRDIIPLIAKVWALPDETATKAVAYIEQNLAAGNNTDGGRPKVSVLLGEHSGDEMVSLIWSLLETLVRVDSLYDRELIAEMITYIKDFWDIEGRIA